MAWRRRCAHLPQGNDGRLVRSLQSLRAVAFLTHAASTSRQPVEIVNDVSRAVHNREPDQGDVVSFLMALIAFAAVFAVYSTIVTVLVEGMHRLLGLRSAGMSEMLRAFYDRTLASLQPDSTPPEAQAPVGVTGVRGTPQARAFANSMAGRSPSESLRWWYVRNWPLVRSFVNSQQARMTTLQFVERLAATPEGAALAQHDRPRLRRALTAAGYEFERLGQAQGVYFHQRAKLLSIAAGICVALFVNLDSVTMFRELARNNEISARLSLMGENARFAAIQAVAQSGDLSGGGAQGEQLTLVTEESQAAFANVASAASDFSALGLPVGPGMFPFCRDFMVRSPSEQSARLRIEGQSQAGFRDERCQALLSPELNTVWAKDFDTYLQDHLDGRTGDVSAFERAGLWLRYRTERLLVIGRNPMPFVMWTLGILISGGLLGLGAPFWFNLFARAASVAAPSARLALGSPDQSVGAASQSARSGTVVRSQTTTDPRDLERGFLIALNRGADVLDNADDLDDPPSGREWGRPPPPGLG